MENDNDALVDGIETEESSPSAPQEDVSGDGLPGQTETADSPAESEGDLQGEDGDLLEEEGEPQEAPADYVTAEELKEIVYGSIEEFFTTEVINVSVQEKGIDAPLEDLGLRDALLFVLVLIALGHAISEIIGGKLKWRK